jgi:hypothetical protein
MNTAVVTTRDIRQYRAHTTNVEDLKIIFIDRNLCDIFKGTGWASQSRYRMVNGRWAFMSGVRLTAADVARIPNRRG